MLDCHKAQEDKTLRIKDTSGLHLNRVRPSHSFTPSPPSPPPRPLPSVKRAGGTIRRGKYLGRPKGFVMNMFVDAPMYQTKDSLQSEQGPCKIAEAKAAEETLSAHARAAQVGQTLFCCMKCSLQNMDQLGL